MVDFQIHTTLFRIAEAQGWISKQTKFRGIDGSAVFIFHQADNITQPQMVAQFVPCRKHG